MKNKLLITLLFVFNFFIVQSQTQILERYPDYQLPYKGGYEAYYKDFHDIIVDKKLQPCSNKNEIYQFSVLIRPDSSIQFIKDLNPKIVESNKCAHDLAREVAKYQKGWNPALVNNINQSAVARFMIFPDDLFSNYREGYVPIFTSPVYNNYGDDHIVRFRKELLARFDLRRFSWNDIFTVETEFTITKEGKLEDAILTKKTGLEEFDRMILLTFKGMKKKWTPASINGQPIDFRYRLTLKAITDSE
ncbi:energy transducer TonB [Epilithonimonas lactis]|uniref:Uncharacterized protein n=1 Tax=Epilithonimonas lactis TaxID=421072 RepID=A0A085BLY8_9FLAO|nr:energy transducer TonB [Epilithonimonas lactis]KFC23483.1 hypothetical protein IO89_02555 [Epilithonimonas lactis]SEQ14800.1 TonB protein C-terminal [Epilithonimonas lactis]